MGVANTDSENLSGPVEKIGVVHHYVRGALILAALAALVGAIWGFSKYSAGKSSSEAQGFDAFRAVYAEKCGVPSYAGPQPEVVTNAYVSSPPLRAAMAKQLEVLKGGGDCFQVAQSLKTLGFVTPKPGSEL